MKTLQPLNTNKIDLKKVDTLLLKIADYVHNKTIISNDAFNHAKLCLLDSLGCAMLALNEEKCTNLLGPIVPGTIVPNGVKVPGTNYVLDPIKATNDLGACIRWLDYNDTWLAQEWGHPSDNIAAILAVCYFINRQNQQNQQSKQNKNEPITLREVFESTIKAYEIQGVLALTNAFNKVGLDHVLLVKVASSAVASKLLGGGIDQTIQTLANAWLDGQSLRVYRHGTNTSQRKSWAAGDAGSRGVELAWMSVFGGEPACLTPITAPIYGVEAVFLKGNKITLSQELESYVIENILFKVLFPAEFHGQTAVEAAIAIHKDLKKKIGDMDKLDSIDKIIINTQEAAMRIINKTGPLSNYADRDHCIQYMVAVALLEGELKSHHYLDAYASRESRIDLLRSKMIVQENLQYSKDYLNIDKRAIPNAIEVSFKDGTKLNNLEVYYPLGHKRRREESLPYLKQKFAHALQTKFKGEKLEKLLALWDMEMKDLLSMDVSLFVDLW